MATKKTRATKTPTSRKPSVHGELRSGPIAGTALIDGATFAQKPVLYANVDGQAIFEGDIVLGTVQEMQKTSATSPSIAMRSIGITGSQFRWPNATVPYVIDPGLPNQQRVTDAIAHWESKTHTLRAANGSEPGTVSRFCAFCFRRWLFLDGGQAGWPAGCDTRPELHSG